MGALHPSKEQAAMHRFHAIQHGSAAAMLALAALDELHRGGHGFAQVLAIVAALCAAGLVGWLVLEPTHPELAHGRLSIGVDAFTIAVFALEAVEKFHQGKHYLPYAYLGLAVLFSVIPFVVAARH